MESYVYEIIWKIAGATIVSVIIVKTGWSRVREKQKLNDLAMYATIEAQKQKWKDELGEQADEG